MRFTVAKCKNGSTMTHYSVQYYVYTRDAGIVYENYSKCIHASLHLIMLPENVSKTLEEKHRQVVPAFLSTSANDCVFATQLFMQHVFITFFQMAGILESAHL